MKSINFFSGIHPLKKVLLSFVGLIFIGTVLLMLPFSTYRGINAVDAFFTSTSAVCVTGLIILDTAKDFTIIGKGIILLLIQFGGFGIMTLSLGLISLFTGSLSLKWRVTFEGLYSDIGKIPVKKILIKVVKYTFVIEFITAIILFTQFIKDFPLITALGHSIFHAVSAFCNAGFSSFSNSLSDFRNNYIMLITISTAVIMGGIGFVVLYELSKIRLKKITKFISGLTIHTKLVLITTIILIISGAAFFYLLEKEYSLKNTPLNYAVLTSFFHSVISRTAGFNTVDIGRLRESTHLILIFLMFIGGSPGSIAGGIKTTTLAVIILLIRSKLKGENNISIWGRTLDSEIVNRGTTLLILSVMFVLIASFLMLTIHDFDIKHSFMSILFEVVSAFGTVGLSMGITSHLPNIDKIILCFVMLFGRLGPLTLIMVLTLKVKKKELEYPKGHVMIG